MVTKADNKSGRDVSPFLSQKENLRQTTFFWFF